MGERDAGLRREVSGAIGRLTLARPAKANALSRAVLEGLAEAAAWFDAQPEVKVVVVSGEGRSFSGGFDLRDRTWSELGPPERQTAVGRRAMEALRGMQAVTIAAVHGHCVGGGVVLAAACDLRVVADDARFRIPEVDLGVPLYWTGIPLLVRELGPAVTKELVMTGRAFDAAEASAVGFANRVVPAAELAAAADELAGVLAAKSALVLRTTKRQVDLGDGTVEDDVAGMAAAFADPESRALAAQYRPIRRAD
jgi:enoyl-CoA hydratase/carnithine racemase